MRLNEGFEFMRGFPSMDDMGKVMVIRCSYTVIKQDQLQKVNRNQLETVNKIIILIMGGKGREDSSLK